MRQSVLIGVWVLSAALGFAGHPNIDRDLEAQSGGAVYVIVQFRAPADAARLQKVRNSRSV